MSPGEARLEGGYPPAQHVLRDLRIWIERDASGARAGMDVVPALRSRAGTVRAGALATLVDVAGGEASVRAVRPEWVATSSLVLHRLAPVTGQRLEARPALLRRTRATVVLEVRVADGGAEPVALATMCFAVLPAREGQRRIGVGFDDRRTEFGAPGAGLEAPLEERIGARALDPAAGRFELALTPYVGNSLGALQGGMTALLVDLAAEAAGGAALGAPVATSDLALHYLALAREGPVRTQARVLRAGSDAALLRVEVREASERLAAAATVGVVRV
jgi:uncharacterized protein (TIGR00369 family)